MNYLERGSTKLFVAFMDLEKDYDGVSRKGILDFQRIYYGVGGHLF